MMLKEAFYLQNFRGRNWLIVYSWLQAEKMNCCKRYKLIGIEFIASKKSFTGSRANLDLDRVLWQWLWRIEVPIIPVLDFLCLRPSYTWARKSRKAFLDDGRVSFPTDWFLILTMYKPYDRQPVSLWSIHRKYPIVSIINLTWVISLCFLTDTITAHTIHIPR